MLLLTACRYLPVCLCGLAVDKLVSDAPVWLLLMDGCLVHGLLCGKFGGRWHAVSSGWLAFDTWVVLWTWFLGGGSGCKPDLHQLLLTRGYPPC